MKNGDGTDENVYLPANWEKTAVSKNFSEGAKRRREEAVTGLSF